MTFDTNKHVRNGIANGAISPYRFVRFGDGDSAVADDDVLAASANTRIAGSSPQYAIADGSSIPVTIGGTTQIELGGSVTRGDRLKAGTAGVGVILAVGGAAIQNVGGIAQRSGVSGDIIPVQIEIYTVAPGDYLS